MNLHSGPVFGYTLRGLPASAIRPGNRGQNNSILGCIGYNGLVHWETKVGSYDRVSYINFLETLLPLLPSDAICIMDNAAFHKGEDVKLVFDRFDREYRFLPPYSPQLNPIEKFWHSLKAAQARLRPRPLNAIELKATIEKAFDEVEFKSTSGYYADMRRYIQSAIEGSPFV